MPNTFLNDAVVHIVLEAFSHTSKYYLIIFNGFSSNFLVLDIQVIFRFLLLWVILL